MNLLIHADPGARSGFLAAWLTDKMVRVSFDSGLELQPQFVKIHHLDNPNNIKSFNGIKIRIKPNLEYIDLLSLLFLRKNVYAQLPEFTKNEYSLETFTKITEFSNEIFQWDSALDYSLYDYVIDFSDMFDNEYMKKFYTTITGKMSTNESINILEQTNKINQISINKNHACSIVKLILLLEQKLNLREEHRFWSVVDIYNSTPVDQLYETVYNSIRPENYGIFLK